MANYHLKTQNIVYRYVASLFMICSSGIHIPAPIMGAFKTTGSREASQVHHHLMHPGYANIDPIIAHAGPIRSLPECNMQNNIKFPAWKKQPPEVVQKLGRSFLCNCNPRC
jgi:hypothetical protein